MGKVAIVKQTDYNNMSQSINQLMTLVGIDTIDSSRVIIKINLCGLRGPETGAITHPLFLDAYLNWLRTTIKYKGEIVVVESNATASLPDLYIDWFGFKQVLVKYDAHFVNLSTADAIKKIDQGILSGQKIPTIFDNSYFISLAKLKTHTMTKISCALKNQFGCIPYQRKVKYHKSLDDAITQANRYFKPDLSIVDGIIALTGVQGPGYGIPMNAGIILASQDPVSCDSSCAKILGFHPMFIKHIRMSHKAKIGSINYDLIGEPLNPVVDSHFGSMERLILQLGTAMANQSRKKAKL
jgi:uncharacterized protein (DUF362 family)